MSAVGRVFSFLGDSSLPSALAAPASLRPHRPRPLDPGDLLSWWGRGRGTPGARGGDTCLDWGLGRDGVGAGGGAFAKAYWGRVQGSGMVGAWLELGGAWLGHGWDRRGLAGSKDLGGSRSGFGGFELVREAQSTDPQPPPFRTLLSSSLPFWGEDGSGSLPLQPGIKGQGPASGRTSGLGPCLTLGGARR